MECICYSLKMGDLVFVKDDMLHSQWSLGKVSSINMDTSWVARSVEL